MIKSNYHYLRQMVCSGDVRLIGIISPPRVVSTALEIALTESPDVDGQINEPFHLSLKDSLDLTLSPEERAYGEILSRIAEIRKASGKRRITVVIKEMAKNLAPGAQAQRWDEVIENKIVLVRNPVLSLESLIRKLSGLADLRQDLIGLDVNAYAAQLGFCDPSRHGAHWKCLLDSCLKNRDYTLLGPVLEEFFPTSNLYRFDGAMQQAYLRRAHSETAQKAGYRSLDDFASSVGYKSWPSMLSQTQNAAEYAPVLDQMFAFRNAGWESLQEHLVYMSKYTIMDTTSLRMEPGIALAHLADTLCIKYDDRMVSGWTHSVGPKFDRGYKKSGPSAFIDKALNSRGFEKPHEVPLETFRFPDKFREYLLRTAFPIYLAALIDERRSLFRSSDDVSALISQSVGSHTLQDTDPIYAYSLMSIASSSTNERVHKLGDIRRNHQDKYGNVFDVVDQHVIATIDVCNHALPRIPLIKYRSPSHGRDNFLQT